MWKCSSELHINQSALFSAYLGEAKHILMCMAQYSICSIRLINLCAYAFSAFFPVSFVEMVVLTSQIESVGITNRARKSQLESCASQLESDLVEHRENGLLLVHLQDNCNELNIE